MARTFTGIGDEDLLIVRCGVPKYLADIPGPISIVDEQAVTTSRQSAIRPHQRLGSRALQERPCFRVNRSAQEIVARGIADVEFNRGIKRGEFNQIRLAKVAIFCRRINSERFFAQLAYISCGRDSEDTARHSSNRAALECYAARAHLRGFSITITRTDGFLAVIQAMVGNLE